MSGASLETGVTDWHQGISNLKSQPWYHTLYSRYLTRVTLQRQRKQTTKDPAGLEPLQIKYFFYMAAIIRQEKKMGACLEEVHLFQDLLAGNYQKMYYSIPLLWTFWLEYWGLLRQVFQNLNQIKLELITSTKTNKPNAEQSFLLLAQPWNLPFNKYYLTRVSKTKHSKRSNQWYLINDQPNDI